MTETKIKRSKFALFIDTTPASTPTWSLVGTGFTTATINYNPEVTTEAYIDEDGKTATVESYAPTIPVEGKAINEEAVFEFIDNLRRTRAVGSAAETDILMVYEYETPVSTDQYPAELQPVTIAIESFGGDAAQTLQHSFTIHFRGDATTGLYDVSGNSFA